MSTMSITRSATAEFVLPVPLGSPENSFGNDPVNPPAAGQPGLWGNIHGVGTTNISGDRYGAGCRPNANCSPTSNVEYRGWYLYSVDVPPGAGTVNIQAYDAGLYSRGTNEQIETGDRRYSTAGTTTTWTVRGPDQTLMDWQDSAVPATCPAKVIPEDDNPATYKNAWATLCSVSAQAEPVRYWIHVQTSGPGDGANRYALRADLVGHGEGDPVGVPRHEHVQQPALGEPELLPGQGGPISTRARPSWSACTTRARSTWPAPQMQVLDPSGAVASSCKLSKFTNPTDSTAYQVITLSPCSIPTTNATGGALYNGQLLTIDIKIPDHLQLHVLLVEDPLRPRRQPRRLTRRHHHLVGGHQGRPGPPRQRVAPRLL